MSEREALLRAVCENPDDDLPRLVFADWLEEHGEPERAEFIRLQVELARDQAWTTRIRMEWAQRESLENRSWVLLSQWKRRWLQELPQHSDLIWGRFSGGFVASVEVSDPFPFFDNLEAVFNSTPLTTVLFRLRFDLAVLAGCAFLARVRQLDLQWVELDDASYLALVQSEYARNLRRLLVRRYNLQYATVNALRSRFGSVVGFWPP